MFGLFKTDPKKKLLREYNRLMEQARDLQRAGKIPEFSEKTAEAHRIEEQLKALEAQEA